jgi:hypothetical protein
MSTTTATKKQTRRKRAPSPEESHAVESLCTAAHRTAMADGRVHIWPSACKIEVKIDDLYIEISSLWRTLPLDDVDEIKRLYGGEDLSFSLKIWNACVSVLDVDWVEANIHTVRQFNRGTWEHRLYSHAHRLRERER